MTVRILRGDCRYVDSRIGSSSTTPRLPAERQTTRAFMRSAVCGISSKNVSGRPKTLFTRSCAPPGDRSKIVQPTARPKFGTMRPLRSVSLRGPARLSWVMFARSSFYFALELAAQPVFKFLTAGFFNGLHFTLSDVCLAQAVSGSGDGVAA